MREVRSFQATREARSLESNSKSEEFGEMKRWGGRRMRRERCEVSVSVIFEIFCSGHAVWNRVTPDSSMGDGENEFLKFYLRDHVPIVIIVYKHSVHH